MPGRLFERLTTNWRDEEMKQCKDLEPLVYLSREGELTAEEESLVREHLRTCPHCSSIRASLRTMHNELDPARSVPPSTVNLAEITLARLNGRVRETRSWFDVLLDSARPALAVSVSALVLLLVVQETRDAMKTSALEERLEDRGSASRTWNPLWTVSGIPALQSLAEAQRQDGTDPRPIMAAIGDDQVKAITSILSLIVGSSDDLFVRLSRRYPNLARVTFEDGLTDQERRILATEGQMLLNDLQNMIAQGASQPW